MTITLDVMSCLLHIPIIGKPWSQVPLSCKVDDHYTRCYVMSPTYSYYWEALISLASFTIWGHGCDGTIGWSRPKEGVLCYWKWHTSLVWLVTTLVHQRVAAGEMAFTTWVYLFHILECTIFCQEEALIVCQSNTCHMLGS